MQLLQRPRRNGAAPPVGKKISPGRRNQEPTSIAGTMRRRGMEEDEILAALRTTNERRCDPLLEVVEVEKIAASVARYEPAGDVVHVSFNGHGSARPPRGYNLTDLGNSERFIAHHGENVRYCYPWRRWLVWTGARWERDDAGRIHKLTKETVRAIYREASDTEDEDRRKALAKHSAWIRPARRRLQRHRGHVGTVHVHPPWAGGKRKEHLSENDRRSIGRA